MIPTGYIVRRRIATCIAAFFVLFLLLTARLFTLGIVRSEELQERAQAQWTSEAVIQPRRGSILDRNGNVLAISATSYTASVSPRQVEDVAKFAAILAPVLDMDAANIQKRASDTSKGGVTLKRQVDFATAQQLKLMMSEYKKSNDKTLNGLYLEQDSRRYYPNGAFAAQLLGLTTVDGVGQSGLEASLNNYLSGKTGKIVQEIDGKGRLLGYSSGEYIRQVDGGSVTLTIDANIQAYCEKAAREAMSVNNAQGIRVLVMNPQTGEILAMVSKPDYDPNDPPRSDVPLLTELMRNRVIADAYEPGSTFKMITLSAALEEKLTNRNEWFYCSGSVYVEGGRIRCWGNPHGAESLTQALENSCNPVFVELGLRLGTDTFYRYLNAFGFGRKTGVDISGEGSGIVISENTVKRVDIARIGFGQSIAVTPIQLLTAACAVVNGGKLLTPYVVKEIRDAEGNVTETNAPVVRGNPISEETSKMMREMLESVVKNGGGKNAYIEGYRVGGKTGTAQVYVDGVVSSSTHIGSFVGFAPMNDPQIAVMVIVDRADRYPDYGSTTAAPFARDILLQSLNYLGTERDKTNENADKKEPVPNVEGETLTNAIKTLKANGFSYVLNGNGSRVVSQMPAPGVQMVSGSSVMLYLEKEERDQDAEVTVPDVSGMSAAAAENLLTSLGFTMKAEGSGLAVAQKPTAEEKTLLPATVYVQFDYPKD